MCYLVISRMPRQAPGCHVTEYSQLARICLSSRWFDCHGCSRTFDRCFFVTLSRPGVAIKTIALIGADRTKQRSSHSFHTISLGPRTREPPPPTVDFYRYIASQASHHASARKLHVSREFVLTSIHLWEASFAPSKCCGDWEPASLGSLAVKSWVPSRM